jgi:hypothetical protein
MSGNYPEIRHLLIRCYDFYELMTKYVFIGKLPAYTIICFVNAYMKLI